MKKNAFTMQFFWIFVLIAGAVILGFFVSLAIQQKNVSEQKIVLSLSRDVEAVFTSALQTPGTVQNISVPRTGVGLKCSNSCECNFLIGGASRGFKDKIIFGPVELKDFDLLFWTFPWKQPFRIASFLLVTNPNVKYVFVYDGTDQSRNLKEKLEKSLPSEMNREFVSSLAAYRPQFFPHTRIVFLRTDVKPLHFDFKNINADAVVIDDSNNAVHYYTKEEGSNVLVKLKSEVIRSEDYGSIYAAIYSADANMYRCGMKKAYDRMQTITKLIIGRTEFINSGSAGACAALYSTVLNDYLVQLKDARYDSPNVGSAIQLLEETNNELIRQSCPQVY